MICRFARSEVTTDTEQSLTIAGYGVTYDHPSTMTTATLVRAALRP